MPGLLCQQALHGGTRAGCVSEFIENQGVGKQQSAVLGALIEQCGNGVGESRFLTCRQVAEAAQEHREVGLQVVAGNHSEVWHRLCGLALAD